MHTLGPDTIFAVYSYDERSGKTIGTRYDMEESMRAFGLGIFPDGIIISTYNPNTVVFDISKGVDKHRSDMKMVIPSTYLFNKKGIRLHIPFFPQ